METMEKVVYLDNAATTACAPEVLAVMTQALSGACGNPSSHYSVGYEAKEFVDTGRAQVAKAINASPAEIFFTETTGVPAPDALPARPPPTALRAPAAADSTRSVLPCRVPAL